MRSTAILTFLKPAFRPLLAAPAPTQLWFALFAIWAFFLTGLIGFPGFYQLTRLNSLLDSKKAQKALVETELQKLQQDATQLEKSKVAQLREIRRVLGYAAQDEIIFDFTQENPY